MKIACCSPSAIESSIPVIVNAWEVVQFDDVNVNVAPTWASPGSFENAMTTTSPTGWVSRTTVNVAVVPDSDTDTDVVDNVNPGGVDVENTPMEPNPLPKGRMGIWSPGIPMMAVSPSSDNATDVPNSSEPSPPVCLMVSCSVQVPPLEVNTVADPCQLPPEQTPGSPAQCFGAPTMDLEPSADSATDPPNPLPIPHPCGAPSAV